ncbi:TonB-dependent receptor [Bacteroides sp.]|uniref:SusC/RagA family TonB-linked outer membrane protein n=1 Tax=Bacteroides sp. TaxID=29523 RepID=UPI0025C6CD1E|nr:TonB-dependent receptor [Bacteroides sp.]
MKKKHLNGQGKNLGLNRMCTTALLCGGLCATPLFSAAFAAGTTSSSVETLMQSITVKGSVVDKNQMPIIGATVMVEGTTTGTITDIDGNYSIDVPNKNSKLVVSYIGYSTQKVDVQGRTSINVTLSEESFNIEEVVVVGYNTVKRGQITGSVDMVKGDKIAMQTSANLEDRLQGKVAGLMISSGSGQPGSSDVKIRIRGTGSINGSNTPLYILDGVMIEPAQFASMNNNDIADIQVLKDASATAIYGSRGSNGVIVITSKRGKEGKTSVSYNLRLGASMMRDPKTRMMTGEENMLYQKYCVEANPNSTSFPLMQILKHEADGTATPDELARLEAARGTNTDWMDEMTQNGFTMEHVVSLNGGNEKTKFFISGSYLNQNGILKKSGLTRYSGRVNLDHKLNKRVDLGVSANIGYTDSEFSDPDSGEGRVGWSNPFFTALLAYPYENAEDWYNGDNPTLITKYYDRNKNLLRLVGSAYLTVKITDWLKFKTNFGMDYYGRKTTSTLDREHPKAQENKGYMSQSTSDMRRYTWTNTLNFNKTFKDLHYLSGVVGFEMYDGVYSSFNQTGYDLDPFMNDSPAGIGDKDGSSKFPPKIGGSRTRSNLISYFTQWNYTYNDRYNFSASVRYDESSKFLGRNKGAAFWSVGAAWDISREEFMAKFDKISQLKLRVSYGTTGNQDGISDFGTRNGYSKASYNGTPGYIHSILGNNNLKWETSEQFDLGADLRLFNNRLNLAADFYLKNTRDLLMFKQISLTSGFESIQTNAGSIRNTGVELSVNATPVQTKDFEWTIGANITYNKNQVKDLGVWANEDNMFVNGDVLYEVGKPLGTWYMVERAGVNPETGEAWFSDQKGGYIENIDAAPKVDKFKSSEVPVFGGFDTSLSYKGFSLSANFTYALNYYIMNATRWYVDNHNFNGNKPAYMLTMWRKPGDVTEIPRFDAKNNPSPWSSQFLENGSYLRLKTLRFSWTAPRKVLDKMKVFSSFNVFCQGENLFTVTNYSGMNPEVSGSTDYMSYPVPLNVTCGVNVTF